MSSGRYIFIFIVLYWVGCQSDKPPKALPKTRQNHQQAALLTYANHAQVLANLPELIAFRKEITTALQQKQPVILFPDNELVLRKLKFSEAEALKNKDFTAQLFLPDTKEPLLNMILDVRPPKPSELRKHKMQGDLVMVEMYNFYYNTVVQAYLDKSSQKVLKVASSPGKLPNLTQKLKKLATKMALAYPEVQQQLGLSSSELTDAYEVKVKNSKSERFRHLYAAVTITPKDQNQTLWVLVDLTTLKGVGYQWMPLWDANRPKLVTERSLQNEVITASYCMDTTRLEMNNWVINYQLTNSDGIEIFDASYKGMPVLKSAKLVDWHVSYPDKKDFGYSDAMGCPKFSSAAVVAFEPPDIQPIMEKGQEIGFSFVQDFRSPVWPKACNYRYQNLFEFYSDGRFRVAGINLGLGCSNNGWYRPVFRINLADKDGQKMEAWKDGHWQILDHENWLSQKNKSAFSPQGYQLKMTRSDGSGYYLAPSQGQFGDNSRGDHAFTYVTVTHLGAGEGELDMPTLGSCCNTNWEQGPEQFLKPAEPLNGHNVIWYVPQMKNSDVKGKQYCWVESIVENGHEGYKTFNGVVGPMFIPFNAK